MRKVRGNQKESRWAIITKGLGRRKYSIIPTVIFMFALANYTQVERIKPSIARRKALNIRKKYKGTIVDVEKLPEEEAIIPVSSLEDLIGLSDQLIKPVLRKVPVTPEEPHTYCVFDGSTRYEYLW